MDTKQVVIIGGGASGLVAAIAAARKGAEVCIIEKMDRIGKKILATGNGRCNMTNLNEQIINCYKSDQAFIKKVISGFNVDETIEFFYMLGILHKTETEGRVYPYSNQASSLLDVLRMEIKRLNVTVIYNNPVVGLKAKPNKFNIRLKDKTILEAGAVIIACGGKAGPQFGCHGDGFKLAESLGHSVVTPEPALVQMICDEWYNKRLKGVRVKGNAKLWCEEKIIAESQGEIQFTEDGLSGICIFDISRNVHTCIKKRKKCSVLMDLFPGYTFDELKSIFQKRLFYSRYKTNEEFLTGLVNKRLIPVILKLSAVEKPDSSCSTLTSKQIDRMIHTFKEWKIPVKDTRSWEHAQVTAGGIDTKEIDPQTMGSIKIPGLFFAGEIINVDGICGGYNLQWAWSTGYIAGENAAIK